MQPLPDGCKQDRPLSEGMKITPKEIFTYKQGILTLFIVTAASGIYSVSELTFKQSFSTDQRNPALRNLFLITDL